MAGQSRTKAPTGQPSAAAPRRNRVCLTARRTAVLAAAFAIAAGAGANAGPIRISDGAARDLSEIATGEQLVLDRRSGPMTFAGRQLSLDNCEAVVGYASDGAYVMVLSGAARLGEARVAAGRMLILPPFGGRPMPEVFDAGRFKAAWSAAAVAGAPRAYSDLVRLERVQRRAVFFGRYQQTAFNVAVSGEAGREAARRVAVGGPAVRALRFGPDASPGVVEQRVVESFIAALTNGDAETAAQLMDPNPFGGSGMGAEGAQARVQFARDLTRERDWRRQLKETVVARAAAGERWLIVGPNGLTVVELRATPDFAFVRSLRVEESR